MVRVVRRPLSRGTALLSLLLIATLLLAAVLVTALLVSSLRLLLVPSLGLLLLVTTLPLLVATLLLVASANLLEDPVLLVYIVETPDVNPSTVFTLAIVKIDGLISALSDNSPTAFLVLNLPDAWMVVGGDTATVTRLAVGVDKFASTGVLDTETTIGLLEIPLLVEILRIALPAVGLATWGDVEIGTALLVLNAVASVAERHFVFRSS